MGPNRHLLVARAFQLAVVLVAFAGVVACMLGWRPAREVGPVPGCWVVLAAFPLAAVAGTLPKWVIPARCPACGRFRAWVFTEFTPAGRAWKYRCRGCGHVHDTGTVWTYERDAE